MKLKELVEKYGEQEVLCWAERADESLEWVNIKLEPHKPKTVWDLQEGDEYFLITTYGTAMRKFAVGKSDNVYVKNGNVRLTKEEAEQDIERRKVETLLLKHGGRRWFNSKGDNWYLVRENYDFETYQAFCILPLGAIYFDTEEQAKKAVIEIGKARIVKSLFEVR